MRRALVLLAACVLGFLPLTSPAAGEETRRLTLLFTNDVQGYIEPCG